MAEETLSPAERQSLSERQARDRLNHAVEAAAETFKIDAPEELRVTSGTPAERRLQRELALAGFLEALVDAQRPLKRPGKPPKIDQIEELGDDPLPPIEEIAQELSQEEPSKHGKKP